MSSAKLHYDGWVAIPATYRRRLGIDTGDKIDLELTEKGLLLRNPNVESLDVANESEPVVEAAGDARPARSNPARASLKRMRNTGKDQEKPSPSLALPNQLRARGRRKSS